MLYRLLHNCAILLFFFFFFCVDDIHSLMHQQHSPRNSLRSHIYPARDVTQRLGRETSGIDHPRFLDDMQPARCVLRFPRVKKGNPLDLETLFVVKMDKNNFSVISIVQSL